MSKTSPIYLSVIVPAYKQQKNIRTNLQSLISLIDDLHISYEIICVIDGVLDGTLSEAKKVRSPMLKVVGYEKNRGKGAAVRYGMSKAVGQIIALVDSGNDLNQSGLTLMLEHMKWYNADIMVGSKRHPASKVVYPWQRRILSFGYQLMVRILFGLKIRDTQVGLKMFTAKVIKNVHPRLLVKQYAFDIEILAVANYLGFNKIYESPVEIKLDFNKSSGIISKGFLRTVFRMLWDTAAVFYRLKIRHYYSDKNLVNWHTDAYPDEI